MYDLLVDGVPAFKKLGVLARQPYYRQPLVGNIDGVNARFTAQFAPLDADASVAVYVGSVLQDPSTYAVDPVAAAITLNAAPASGVLADYTYIEQNNDQILTTLGYGFDEMVRRLGDPDWQLAPTGASFQIVDAGSGADPKVNGKGFSVCRPALNAYMLCSQFAHLRAQAQFTAMHNKQIRTGSILVNSTRQPDQILALMKDIDLQIWKVLDQLDVGGSIGFGAYVGPLKSPEYRGMFQWQPDPDEGVSPIPDPIFNNPNSSSG